MLSLAFLGDLCINGRFAQQLAHSQELFSPALSQLLQAQDFVIANLEGPETHQPNSLRPNKRIVNPSGSIAYLSKHNIKLFSLANNHIMDCGEAGLKDTITAIEKVGGKYFGAGIHLKQASAPLILEKNGIRVALFSCGHQEGQMASQQQAGVCHISDQKLEIQENVQAKILLYHGGAEYTFFPMPAKRKLLHKIAKQKEASLIVSHHPHVLQGMEVVAGREIWYSLGNFLFDVPKHQLYEGTNKSGILIAKVSPKGDIQTQLIPIFLDRKKGIVDISPHKSEDLLKRSNFKNFGRKWQKEAFRVYQKRKLPMPQQARGAEKISEKKNRHIRRIQSLLAQLQDEAARAILLGALSEYLRQRIS